MDFNQLKQALGPIKDAGVVLNLPDSDYHGQVDFATSSTVKDYLSDPHLAGQRRVLKTAPPKVWSDKVRKSMRIGRAIHAYVFEGTQIFKSRFPIFSEGRRGTKAWDKFVEANTKAMERDDILTLDEAKVVDSVGKNATLSHTRFIESMEKNGVRVLAQIPECSFYLTYQSGLSVKVRADLFLLCQSVANPSQYFFQIIDGKTTERSVTDFTGLGFTISGLKYDLSGAMYLNTIHECLQQTKLWPQLIPGFDVSAWPETISLWGSFEIFWMSTSTLQSGYQSLMTLSDSEENIWMTKGITQYYLGLQKMQIEMNRLNTLLDSDPFELVESFSIAVPTLKKDLYVLRDCQEELGQLALASSYHNEKVLQDRVKAFSGPGAETQTPGNAVEDSAASPPAESSSLDVTLFNAPAPEKEEDTDRVESESKTGEELGLKNRSHVDRLRKSEVIPYLEAFNVAYEPNSDVRTLKKILKEKLFN